ncbi:MAG: STAS domain-containing protein [Melioribacteraceae bacterium]|nr:STAS domain-containing protein [Melioribacteraceae bacterium]
MHIVEEKVADILIESVKFDRATINESALLKENINRGIEKGFIKIIIDLSACEYMDSTFLGVLVSALKTVSRQGGDVKLVGFKPQVHAMFELTRMFRVFQVYSDLPNAIQSFSKNN